MKEVIYKPVVGYEGLYEVSSLGEVFSLNYMHTGKRVKLKAMVVSNGYVVVCLRKQGSQKTLCIHRLVAEAFIPNLDSKPEVDHINTIRTDNRVENLRWVSSKENHLNPNTREAYKVAHQKLLQDIEWRRKHKDGCQKRSQNPEWRKKHKVAMVKACAKEVYCIELDKVFESAYEAAIELGLIRSAISACCRGKRQTTGGYHFQFHIQE